MNKEKISILITNFNKEKFIEECILSCLSQNYNNLEIIIVDNSSTDRSMSIIKKYSNKLMQLRVLLQFIAIIVLVLLAYFFKN